MVPELEKPRITEIHVRMDCNGCVQKIKRALHGINGIYDLYIDFPNQKLTIVGWADPEKIVKAIKKTRKTATICSHTEPPDPAGQPLEQPPDGGAPPSDAANAPTQEAPPAEPPKDAPPPENPPQAAPENNPNNSRPEPDKRESQSSQNGQQQPPPAGQPPSGQKDVGEVHVVYHHPPPPPPPEYDYRYGYGSNFGGDHWYSSYPRAYDFQRELPPVPLHPLPTPLHSSGPPPMKQPPAPAPTPAPTPALPQRHPIYVTHSYNAYKPSSYVTEYHHDYAQPQPSQYRYYAPARNEQYAEQDYLYNHPHYYQGGAGSSSTTSNGPGNGNIGAFFSDENPNACRIM